MKISVRTCIVCRTKGKREDFFRITRKLNDIFLDLSYKSDGRSAYVCKDMKCICLLTKKKSLNYAFKKNISLDNYDIIISEMKNIIKPENK